MSGGSWSTAASAVVHAAPLAATGEERIEVVFLMRRPRHGVNYSVELLFREIINNLSPRIKPTIAVSRFLSLGFFRRAYNVVEAAFRQGDINHITGDVHILAFLLRPERTVLTVLDCGRIEGEPDLRKTVIRLLWYRIPVRRCAVVTVISSAVREQLLRHVDVDPTKIRVVPVPVPGVYRRLDKVFDADSPRILQIGAAPNKNRERMFEALRGIRCRLAIVGPLSKQELATLARCELQYENFVDISTEQMFSLYCQSDMLAFASTFEGFGMPIIEANLVGRPVVTSLTTSMPEVAGDAACLVDPFDVASIRAGFLKVLNDRDYREQLVEAGFANARRFEAKEIAKRYEDIYRELRAGQI